MIFGRDGGGCPAPSRPDVAEAVREGIADAEAGRFADAETIKAKHLALTG